MNASTSIFMLTTAEAAHSTSTFANAGRSAGSGSAARIGGIQNRVSIEERPPVVEKRFYYGDWEVDLVEGANHEGFLLTLVERKCGHLLMHPLGSKKADEVTTAIIVELWPFVGKIRSLTMDNGKEFSGHETVAALLQTKVYFAHPYASWERGTNENTNGLIRQYLGMSFRILIWQCANKSSAS